MTNKINGIDVSECPCKDDDKCLEAPILNEYGDLIDYQDCEPQTLCPYRSKTKIQRLQEENEGLKSLNDFNVQKIEVLQEENKKLRQVRKNSPDIQEPYVYLYRQIKKQCHKLEEENDELKKKIESYDCNANCYKYKEANKYRQALEEMIDIAEKLITETPEYHSCYYKDECGDNCTPKKQSKVEYCCYENVDKILTIICEVLNEQK